jgi:hypothetical protein
MNSLSFFNAFAGKSEVFDKYFLTVGLLLFLYFSTNSRREKLSIFWTIILSFLIARLVITPVIYFCTISLKSLRYLNYDCWSRNRMIGHFRMVMRLFYSQ